MTTYRKITDGPQSLEHSGVYGPPEKYKVSDYQKVKLDNLGQYPPADDAYAGDMIDEVGADQIDFNGANIAIQQPKTFVRCGGCGGNEIFSVCNCSPMNYACKRCPWSYFTHQHK